MSVAPQNNQRQEAPATIGILDSGVGGLSVLREIRAALPGVSIHYVGDSAHCPYGTKSPEEISERVTEIADYLLAKGAGLLVIACNSATIHAVGPLRATYPIPIVGMEPGVKPAAEKTKSGVVGVLATEASIAGEKFHQLVDTHADGVRVITRPCPKFVELVEAGILEGAEVEDAVNEAVAPMLEAGADVLVLGCTHYPFLHDAIRAQVPDGVTIIDTGPAVARRVEDVLTCRTDLSETTAEIHIETTGALANLERLFPTLLPGVDAVLAKSNV